MIRWGISALAHDAALAVFDDKKLVFASHSERYSGIKNDKWLNGLLINDALSFACPVKFTSTKTHGSKKPDRHGQVNGI